MAAAASEPEAAPPPEPPVEEAPPESASVEPPEAAEAEEDDFDLNAYLAHSIESARSLSIVDEMRSEGETVRDITLNDLIDYLQSRKSA
jgi:hypothetical protein